MLRFPTSIVPRGRSRRTTLIAVLGCLGGLTAVATATAVGTTSVRMLESDGKAAALSKRLLALTTLLVAALSASMGRLVNALGAQARAADYATDHNTPGHVPYALLSGGREMLASGTAGRSDGQQRQ